MEDWQLVCLLAVLVAILPVATVQPAKRHRCREGKGSFAGEGVRCRGRGPGTFEFNYYLAADSVVARFPVMNGRVCRRPCA